MKIFNTDSGRSFDIFLLGVHSLLVLIQTNKKIKSMISVSKNTFGHVSQLNVYLTENIPKICYSLIIFKAVKK